MGLKFNPLLNNGFDLTGTSGGGGVTSLNGLSGSVTLAAGSGITLTPSGSTITIASTGGSGANTALSNLVATSINQDLVSGSDNNFNIGTTSNSWSSIFAHVYHGPTAASGSLRLSTISCTLQDLVGTTAMDFTSASSGISFVSHKLVNVLDPTNPQDAATKNYVDIHSFTLPAPIQVLASYTANSFGAQSTFVGNNSNLDQTHQAIVIGSTDTAIAGNSTSSVLLFAGDNTAASSTGSGGGVSVQAGNIISGSGTAGGISVTAGGGDSGGGGTVSLNAGSSVTGFAGNISLLSGSSTAGTGNGGPITISAGNSFGGVAGSITLSAGSGPTNGNIILQTQGSASIIVNNELIPSGPFSSNLGSATNPFNTVIVNEADFYGSSSGFISVVAPATITSYGLVLPATQGASNTFLRNDGSGNLSWSPSSSTITFNKENITLTPTNITNQFVDLAHLTIANSLTLAVTKTYQVQGSDYTLSTVGGVTRLTFAGDLATGGVSALVSGNILNIQYSY